MPKYIFLALLNFVCFKSKSQSYFEGEITYKLEIQKTDSSFDETSILTIPQKVQGQFLKMVIGYYDLILA